MYKVRACFVIGTTYKFIHVLTYLAEENNSYLLISDSISLCILSQLHKNSFGNVIQYEALWRGTWVSWWTTG